MSGGERAGGESGNEGGEEVERERGSQASHLSVEEDEWPIEIERENVSSRPHSYPAWGIGSGRGGSGRRGGRRG